MDPTVLAVSVLASVRMSVILAVGACASKWPKHEALFTREVFRVLSRMCTTLFLPALIVSSSGATVNFAALRASWQLCVASTFSIALSVVTAWVCQRMVIGVMVPGEDDVSGRNDVLRIFRPVRLAISFPNVTAFPLVLMAALCEQDAINSDYEDSLECYEQAKGMVFIYVLGWQIWYHGWASHDFKTNVQAPETDSEEQQKLPCPLTGQLRAEYGGFWARLRHALCSPSIVAVACGMIIAFVDPLQDMLFENPDSFLRPLGAAFETIGAPFVAVQMLVMGGSLAQTPNPDTETAETKEIVVKNSESRRRRLVGFLLVMCRLFLVPSIGFLSFNVARIHGLVTEENRLMQLTMLVEFAMPSSPLVIVVLHQLRKPAAAALMAKLYLWQYVASVLTITLWTALAIYMVY